MATYAELQDIRSNNEGLLGKVLVAASIKAHAIMQEVTPGANRLQWALDTLDRPEAVGGQLLNYVIAENNSATASQITGASDTAIQTNVDDAVDVIVPTGA